MLWDHLLTFTGPRRVEPDLPYLTSILEMFEEQDVTRDIRVQNQQAPALLLLLLLLLCRNISGTETSG